MRHYLPAILLLLTLAIGFSLAAAPPESDSPTESRPREVTELIGNAPQPVQQASFETQSQQEALSKAVKALQRNVKILQREIGQLMPMLSMNTPHEHHILKQLQRATDIQAQNQPLSEVLRTLAAQSGINIHLDTRGLKEVGLTPETPVTIEARGIKLKSILVLMLEPQDLGFTIRDETLVVTSKTRAQGKPTVRTYYVADLVIPTPHAGPTSADDKTAAASPDFDALIKLIQTTVAPDSWQSVGGNGSISKHEPALSLVVRQSAKNHWQIEGLINQFRAMQYFQVSLETHYFDNLPNDFWEQLPIDLDLEKNKNGKLNSSVNGPLGGITLNELETRLLLETIQKNERANLIQAPQVILWNGQTAALKDYTVGGKRQPLQHSFYIQPVLSANRRYVRLNLRVSDLKSPDAPLQTYVNTVPDRHSILIELATRQTNETGVPVPESETNTDVPVFKKSQVDQPRRFILIHPTLIIQEEEEEVFNGLIE